MKFRTQLITVISALTLLTLGGASIAISAAVNRAQERQLDEALLAEAHEEAFEASQLGGDTLAISDKPGPYANDVGPLTKYGVIFAPTGSVLASTPTFHGACEIPKLRSLPAQREQPFDMWCGKEHVRAVLVPLPRHSGTVLLLAAPRTDLDGDAAFLAKAIVVALAASVAWTLVVATWLVRRLTRNHSTIMAVAQRVAAGDLTARIGDQVTHDEIGQLARNIDIMIDRLASTVTAHERFVANAAHELQSPVTALYAELQLTLRKPRDAAEYQQSTQRALEATRRLKTLAQDLLTLTKSGHTQEPTEQHPIADVVDEAIAEVLPVARAKNLLLGVNIDPCVVTGNKTTLVRLLRNVLDNAVNHSNSAGRVDVTVKKGSHVTAIYVEDQGPGVGDADRERIFEPFFRGRDAHGLVPAGAGLGLSIARDIAHSYGGDVVVSAEPRAVGAKFVITLPCADNPDRSEC